MFRANTMRIGLGTAAIGRPDYINIRQESKKRFHLPEFQDQAYAVLDAAYTAGIRYFDTAPGYGIAEKILMNWVHDRAYVDTQIASKWGYTYTANFNATAKVHEVKEHTLAKLNEQWKATAQFQKNLKIYQIHSATLESQVLDNPRVIHRLAELKREHKLKIGVTTSGAQQTEVVRRALEVQVEGKQLFDVYQVTYNLLDQSFGSLSQVLHKHRKGLVIKEALANGRIFENPSLPNYRKMYDFLGVLAQKYEVGFDALALRFVLDCLPKAMVLSGASQVEHVHQNMQANSFQLSAEELDQLKQFSVVPKYYWEERKMLGWN